MRSLRAALALCGAFATSCGAFAQSAIPSGTILPMRLDMTISSKMKAGEIVRATVMQDVKLAGGMKIRHGSKVSGEIVEVTPATNAETARVSLRFDTLTESRNTMSIRTNLRAIASLMEVDEAQVPETGADYGTAKSAWTTRQIGGDQVYRGGGPVMEGGTKVGEPVYDGVRVHVVPNPDGNCRGEVDGNDSEQEVWVFSANACGTYGLENVEIVHAGRTEPAGEIVLAPRKGELKIPRGAGMLLRVNASDAKKS